MCITLSRTNHGAEDVLKVEVLSHQISWGGEGVGGPIDFDDDFRTSCRNVNQC